MITETSYHAYPKVDSIGHRQIAELFLDPVVVEEKLDGSQFSWGIFDGELKCRSRGQQINMDAPDSLFTEAVEVVRELAPKLVNGWTYRAEYLKKPKHNCLSYERIPKKHLMLFDVNYGHESYVNPAQKQAIAQTLGLECTPCYWEGSIHSMDRLEEFIGRESILGGEIAEGIVVKNYSRFTPDGKALMGKFVRPEFKERHQGNWKEENPNQGDIIQRLIAEYKTHARWHKGVQHLGEAGVLLGEPKDIGPLIREVQSDIQKECGTEIRAALWSWAWPQINRGVVGGLPEWYKEKLAGEMVYATGAPG